MTLFFFDKKNASISGRLVEDSNRDFTEIAADGGFELGFDGVRVELLNSSGHVIATTFTDHSGRYTFGNLSSGSYIIRVPTEIDGQTLAPKDVGGFGVDSDANANGVTDVIHLSSGERLNEIDVVYGDYPDGVVDGAKTGELMNVGYSDAQGDLVTEGSDVIFGNGGNDDIRAAGGNDTVSGGAGNDTIDGGTGNDLISGNGGNDTITGGTGNDTIFGDNTIDPNAGTFTGPRESFEWDLLTQSQIDSSAVQDTGVVTVTYTRTADTGSHESSVDTHTYLNVAGIDDGTETIDATSSLSSQTNGNGNLGAFQWQFSDPVGNLEFNINDLDGHVRVTIRAFDANGNEVPVILNAGSDVTIAGNTATTIPASISRTCISTRDSCLSTTRAIAAMMSSTVAKART